MKWRTYVHIYCDFVSLQIFIYASLKSLYVVVIIFSVFIIRKKKVFNFLINIKYVCMFVCLCVCMYVL